VSVQFDHLELGTPESTWRADRRLGTGDGTDQRTDLAESLESFTRVLVIAAHPDDESLGAGGLIAAAAAGGAFVHVIVATNGEASHPESPTHTALELAEIRRPEVRAAVAQLDPSARVTLLDLPDGRLDEHGHELTDVIAAHLAEPTLLVTPWRDDRHPDHEACARAGADAARTNRSVTHWQYPIWLWHWAAPDDPDVPWSTMRMLDLDPAAQRAKQRAIACHVSQHEPLSNRPGDEAILPPRLIAHFDRPFETFVVTSDSESRP
jgi:LmbE family N-acetylglucosaminyl deacetylase